jgi:hypothetical protein
MKKGMLSDHVHQLLARLKNVKATPNGWDACCPAHDDAHPSLSNAVGEGGRILIHCRSQGCSAEQITAALDLTMTSLFTPQSNGTPKPEIEAFYDYRDEKGNLLFQVVRFRPRVVDGKPKKDFRQRRPDGKGGYVWKLKGVRRVLYRLPQLVQADPKKLVFVVEGEKDVDNLSKLGLIATTNPQGAGKWRSEYNDALAGRHVVIIPDNDEPGREHARKVAQALRAGAASVRIVELPGLPEKGDVSDWLRSPGNDKEALLKLAEAAPTVANGATDEAPEGGNSESPAAALLLQSAADAVLFHAPDKTAYASVPIGEGDAASAPRATLPIRSRAFRSWLAHRYYRATQKAARAQLLTDAVAHFEARALFDGPCLDVFCRVGTDSAGTIWLDLGCPGWKAVKITAQGWQITDRPPVKLRRSASLLALPSPVPGGSIKELRPFVNVRDEDWPLLVVCLLAVLRPRGPYPVVICHGLQGSAKSTTARVLRAVTDPSSAPLRCEPREARDLMIMANNSWVVALDNLSSLPPWLSDALCRLSTGGGFSTRQLFTDADEVVFEAQRPVLLTGIEELATRSDLLDRSVILQLPTIPEEKYRTEAELWAEFEKARPRILGALLDALAGALKHLPAVQLHRKTRMADFATWGAAVEMALGWKQGTFLEAYTGNRGAADELAVESSPLYGPLCQLVQAGEWQGTPTALWERLTEIAGQTVARSQSWPKRANALTRQLKRLTPNLHRLGFEIDLDIRKGDKKGSRQIRIGRAPAAGNSSSEAPEAPETGAGPTVSDAPPPGSDAPEPGSDGCPPPQNAEEDLPAGASGASDGSPPPFCKTCDNPPLPGEPLCAGCKATVWASPAQPAPTPPPPKSKASAPAFEFPDPAHC